jgi:hypothetical protein
MGEKVQKLDLCQDCAKAKGVNDPATIPSDLMHNLMHNYGHWRKDSRPLGARLEH